jgi:hypothetical protein
MYDEELLDEPAEFALTRGIGTARARLVVFTAVLSSLVAAGCCIGAILAHAPVAATPLIAAVCVGCPMFAVVEVPRALAELRLNRGDKALTRLRRHLAELPETEHPLGL